MGVGFGQPDACCPYPLRLFPHIADADDDPGHGAIQTPFAQVFFESGLQIVAGFFFNAVVNGDIPTSECPEQNLA